MKEEQIKGKIILTVKNAIADNADIDVDTDTVTTDCNGVDRLAEQVAEEVYKMFEPVSIDEQGALGKRGLTENREQQIEEMQKIICKDCADSTKNEMCELPNEKCNSRFYAELFYNAGYRKTFTSIFVSNPQRAFKEGYVKGAIDRDIEIAELKAENERLTEKLRQVLLSIDTVKEMNTMCNIDEQRKQAVKRTAKNISDWINYHAKNGGFGEILADVLEELATTIKRNYGVTQE